MTTQPLTLQLETRSILGKKVRQLRRQGITPVHLYGKGIQSLHLQGESAAVRRIVTQAGGTAPVSLSIEGDRASHMAFIREVHRHPLTETILHVDFYQVPMTELMQAEVPVYLVGEAPAVRLHNGILLQPLHAVRVECLPLEMPQYVELDIAGLDDFEKALHVSDISLGDKVTVLNDPEDVIARVNPPRVIEEEIPAVVAEQEALAEEAEQPAEAETTDETD